MVGKNQFLLVLGAILFLAPTGADADPNSPLIINEVYVHTGDVCTPPNAFSPGVEKFIEIFNRSSTTVDTTNWWLCDQPAEVYRRLLQEPTTLSGPPTSPGILLQPGDYLVIRFHGIPPPWGDAGDYATQPNSTGTTTHILRMFIPDFVLACHLRATNNISIWDQSSPNDPDNPSWDSANAIRDFIAWGPDGIYIGVKRGCIASNPLVGLWPLPIAGDCVTGVPTPEFVAVNTNLAPPGSTLSFNYNNGTANDPADYFIAPITEGEPNIMPGDLDGDFDMDTNDYDLFVSCLNQPADPPNCVRADFDQSGTVDCNDWPAFIANWQLYSILPVPQIPKSCVPCTPGDFNGDGVINGDDLQGAVGAFTSTNPPCAADVNSDGVVDCKDVQDLARTMLAAPPDCLKGDVNFDGLVDGNDISFFIALLMSPPECISLSELCVADMNLDQVISIDDVDPLVVSLLADVR